MDPDPLYTVQPTGDPTHAWGVFFNNEEEQFSEEICICKNNAHAIEIAASYNGA